MFINSSIFFDKFVTVNLVKILALVTVSGNPPLFVIITAQPFAEASRLVLPKGSSQREQATAILVFLKILITSLCFLKPSICALGWFKGIFSRFSSPIIWADQSGYLLSTFVIDFEKISYPFALFNLPTKVIHLFFLF